MASLAKNAAAEFLNVAFGQEPLVISAESVQFLIHAGRHRELVRADGQAVEVLGPPLVVGVGHLQEVDAVGGQGDLQARVGAAVHVVAAGDDAAGGVVQGQERVQRRAIASGEDFQDERWPARASIRNRSTSCGWPMVPCNSSGRARGWASRKPLLGSFSATIGSASTSSRWAGLSPSGVTTLTVTLRPG